MGQRHHGLVGHDDLLRRWQDEGDAEALDTLLRAEIGLLKKRLRRQGRRAGLVRSDASVSDLAQEAAVAVIQAEGARFIEVRAFRAYLWRAAWRLLLRRVKRRREERPLDPALSDASIRTGDAPLDSEETARAVRFALQLLPADDRELLEWSYFEERSNDQIAGSLGISSDAAKMRLVRARRKLAGKLAAWRALVEGDNGREPG